MPSAVTRNEPQCRRGTEQCGWEGEAERRSGFQINDELEFGGLVNRDVARFGAVEDLLDVIAEPAATAHEVRPIVIPVTLPADRAMIIATCPNSV
jgi:hypothetical protein